MRKEWRLDIAALAMRIVLGLILIYYGSQKRCGLFGGRGYRETIDGMGAMGIHPILANLSIFAEVFGAVFVLLGLLTPAAALVLGVNMAVATWFNATKPGVLAAIIHGDLPTATSMVFFTTTLFTMSLTIILIGAGSYSLDARLFKPAKKR